MARLPTATPGLPATGRYSGPLLQSCIEAFSLVLPLERPADAVLSVYFRQNHHLGRRDRALVADSVYAMLRRRRLLGRIAGTHSPRRSVFAAWATLLGASVQELQAIISADDAEWLAAVRDAALEPQPFETECDLPDWLIERLRARFDDTALLELAKGLQQQAPLDLRVNVLKATRESVLERLSAESLSPEPTPYSPEGVRLHGKPPVKLHPLFLDGSIEVQDESSQLVCHLVAPRRGEMAVDFCAGAGGKTLALGAMMRSSGRLYAFDTSAGRLAKLKTRLARSGLSNVYPARLDRENDAHVKRLSGKIDRVLVDAPCTGLGRLRRSPDLKWRQAPGDIDPLVSRQASILESAARLVKPGGRLVYATCSILDEENRGVVEPFRARHPEFAVVSAEEILARERIPLATGEYLELSPHRHGTDGFFAAVLERRGAQGAGVP